MKKFFKVLGIIVGVIALVITTIIGVTFMATAKPVEIADSFIDKMRNDDQSSAYELFSIDAKKEITPAILNKISEFLSSYFGDTKLNSRAFKFKSGKPGMVTLEYRTLAKESVATNEGDKYDLIFIFIKEDKEWKILSFESIRVK